jgi:vacuolar-type H+-ATPase subunit H
LEVEINLPLTIFGIVLIIYGLILAIVAIRNGRILRESVGEFRLSTEKLITEARDSTERLITEARDSTERLITESRESTERLIREIHDSLQRSIEAADRRRAEDTRYLAELIAQVSRG